MYCLAPWDGGCTCSLKISSSLSTFWAYSRTTMLLWGLLPGAIYPSIHPSMWGCVTGFSQFSMSGYELCSLQVEHFKSQTSSVVTEARIKIKLLSPWFPESNLSRTLLWANDTCVVLHHWDFETFCWWSKTWFILTNTIVTKDSPVSLSGEFPRGHSPEEKKGSWRNEMEIGSTKTSEGIYWCTPILETLLSFAGT